jgi:hypothetical protein
MTTSDRLLIMILLGGSSVRKDKAIDWPFSVTVLPRFRQIP